jgi:uncharacterized membrane protein
MRARRGHGDEGQLAPLYAVVLLVACGAIVLLGHLGQLAHRRAQARTAADAAALAGAASDRTSAAEVASSNGAVLEDFTKNGSDVEVRVRVGTTHATAKARREAPASAVVAGGGDRRGLAPAMVAALSRADALLGRAVPVVSGYRSPAEQQSLWNARDTNPFPVAAPGTSAHERGMAIDVPLSFVPALRAVAAGAGLCQPLPQADPIHFEPCRPTSRG